MDEIINLKQERNRRHIARDDAADLCHVSKSTVVAWELRNRIPTPEHRRKYREMLEDYPVVDDAFYARYDRLRRAAHLSIEEIAKLSQEDEYTVQQLNTRQLSHRRGVPAYWVMKTLENFIQEPRKELCSC